MRPIDADAIVFDYGGLAKIHPYDFRGIAEYFAKQIDAMPTIEPERKTQWIPCSERLPENDKSVLATTAWGEVTIAERIYPPINDTCWFIHDGNTNATIDDVIAWMPLPEPYEGGNDA